jgi:hypothetical protein
MRVKTKNKEASEIVMSDDDWALLEVLDDPYLYNELAEQLERERNEREDLLLKANYLWYLKQPRDVNVIQRKRKEMERLPHLVASKGKEFKRTRKGEVPTCGGIYFICRDGELLYVGQSTNINTRLREHHWGFGSDIFYIECNEPIERYELEDWFIKNAHPTFNVTGTKNAV